MKEKLLKDLLAIEEELFYTKDIKIKNKLKSKYNKINKKLKELN